MTVSHIQSSHATLLHSQTKQSKFSRSQLLTIQSIYLNANLGRATTVTIKSCYFFTQSDKTVEFFISIYSICLNANLIITHSNSQPTVPHIQNSRVTLLQSDYTVKVFQKSTTDNTINLLEYKL